MVSINEVTLRQARLVPGWVTVFGRVNQLVRLCVCVSVRLSVRHIGDPHLNG